MIRVIDGKVSFEFTEEARAHAHNILSGKMMHAEDIGHYEGKLVEQKKSEIYKERMARYKAFIQATVPER